MLVARLKTPISPSPRAKSCTCGKFAATTCSGADPPTAFASPRRSSQQPAAHRRDKNRGARPWRGAAANEVTSTTPLRRPKKLPQVVPGTMPLQTHPLIPTDGGPRTHQASLGHARDHASMRHLRPNGYGQCAANPCPRRRGQQVVTQAAVRQPPTLSARPSRRMKHSSTRALTMVPLGPKLRLSACSAPPLRHRPPSRDNQEERRTPCDPMGPSAHEGSRAPSSTLVQASAPLSW